MNLVVLWPHIYLRTINQETNSVAVDERKSDLSRNLGSFHATYTVSLFYPLLCIAVPVGQPY